MKATPQQEAWTQGYEAARQGHYIGRTPNIVVGDFVQDRDCLVGRVTHETGPETVTVVRVGDDNETLEQFEYARRDLTVLALISDLDTLPADYVASLFTFDAS